ncbi:uncharacterized protein LOC135681372 [Rhopilema esculentum]|uniref:uncharacterized protein LOC135681372 n=1 Tax=Rhopilema esculentum TaxID=499914 RepID=UPI0031D76CA1
MHSHHAAHSNNPTPVAVVVQTLLESDRQLQKVSDISVLVILVLCVVAALVGIVALIYFCHKRIKERDHEELLKDVETKAEDVELTTGLMREENSTLKKAESRPSVPKIRIQKASRDEGTRFHLLSDTSSEDLSSSDED